MATVPSAELDGRTWIMVPQETGRLVQGGGGPILVSRREVEGMIAKIEKYIATNHPAGAEPANTAKLAAFRELLAGA